MASCNNRADTNRPKDLDPEAIFYDYRVWGEEGKDDVTVMLQYRFGRGGDNTLLLQGPTAVKLDGEPLRADSAGQTGTFYEAVKPLKAFAGEHSIVFTDNNKKEHKENFRFTPFTLAAELPEKLKKQPFRIQLNGLPKEALNLRLVMIDTAFATADVNEEIFVSNGELKVDSVQLAALSTGPVTIEIYREEEGPLKNASKRGGRLQMTYSLRREIELVE